MDKLFNSERSGRLLNGSLQICEGRKIKQKKKKKKALWEIIPVVGNLPANAGDTGLGRSHIPQGK